MITCDRESYPERRCHRLRRDYRVKPGRTTSPGGAVIGPAKSRSGLRVNMVRAKLMDRFGGFDPRPACSERVEGEVSRTDRGVHRECGQCNTCFFVPRSPGVYIRNPALVGVWQVNILIPATAPTGSVPITIYQNSVASNDVASTAGATTISIKQPDCELGRSASARCSSPNAPTRLALEVHLTLHA